MYYHFSRKITLLINFFKKVHNLYFEHQNTLYTVQVRVKKIVPIKKVDIGMEVYYLCQPNTYVIAHEFGEQQ